MISPGTMFKESSVTYKKHYGETPKGTKTFLRSMCSRCVHMVDPPVYKNVFQKMMELYGFPGKPSATERFWVADIEENQVQEA